VIKRKRRRNELICVDCEYWDFRFETDAMLMGYCSKLNKLVEGALEPFFNDCPLPEYQDKHFIIDRETQFNGDSHG